MNKQQKISDLKKHIGFWMRLVSNNVSSSFAKKLEGSGVTVAEWVVLREMHACDQTIAPSEIAELTGLTRGAISKLVERLLEKKLVTRKESSRDRRFQGIKLTPTANDLIPKLAAIADENDEEFFSVLSKQERSELRRILVKVSEEKELYKVPIS